MTAFSGAAALDRAGFQLQAVLAVADLPAEWGAGLGDYRQLILFGHRGQRLWEAVAAAGGGGPDPIDDYTRHTVDAWLADHLPGVRHTLLYPALPGVPLPAVNFAGLGEWLGWQRPSPLGLGIHPDWGTWFAYRAAVLADSVLPLSVRVVPTRPCDRCSGKPCVSACPAGAVSESGFKGRDCASWRLAPESRCAGDCAARRACPVGPAHRYGDEQMRHAAACSLSTLKCLILGAADG